MSRLDNPRVARALERTLRLRPGSGGEFDVADSIVGILEMLPLIGDSYSQSNVAKDLSGAAGGHFVYATVPEGQIWKVNALARTATTGLSAISVQGTRGAGFGRFTPLSASDQAVTPSNLWLYPGDSIGCVTTGNVADTSVTLTFHYTLYTSAQ